jgi:hypothetical protein
MRSRSKHYNQQHPAIGYVACPTCHVPSGQKCIKTNGSQQNTETHVSRVKLYIKEFPDGVTPAAAFGQTPTPALATADDQTDGGRFDPQSGQGI